MKIYVLRLFHRAERDKRITTHCALVSRAFLTEQMYYCGNKDEKLEKNIEKVNKNFGSNFSVVFIKDWKSLIKNFDGLKIHLTMYGIPLLEKIDYIKSFNKVLIIVGSEKVPKEVYEMVDLNISITNQPHSEIAALAVFLDRIFEGKEFYTNFENAMLKIIPSEKGKIVKKQNY
ncbi:MAG: tRNA (cytidine(56)-2'-O)-methyltransferase [Candidatus Aenigmarchaeota archaeon]|nr:tRNA (cytidine(56)-2'-O)-methyltransferase [Candidatus Aenigmarchaeota archaeon]MDW8149232.1 tRNA (cytidine(56)-2'-O)-methyltransferase [Candidatus Aenigmarchaeota archaeon]